MRRTRLTLSVLAAATLLVGLVPVSGSQAAPTGQPQATDVRPTAAVEPRRTGDVRPVPPEVRTVDVRGVSRAGRAIAPGLRSSSYAALTGAEPVSGVAVAGVTWRGDAPAGLAMSVRTRTDGAWSGWTDLEYDDDHGPDPGSTEATGARPGTDPIVLGAVDDVQLRVTSDRGTLPAGMQLDLVDPGRTVGSPTAEPAPGVETRTGPGLPGGSTLRAPSVVVTDPVSVARPTPRPEIFTRADWGADESLKDCCVEYGEVHAAFVHHTVNANDYTRAETPAVIRGIYAYHTQSRGWRDIGYNFLIDKFGRIWEGRAGGMALPVIGAHTLNYNEYAFAASAIGNFETVQPRAAMLDAYARLFAWKLSLHGVRPGSRQLVGGTMFDAVNGHRDAAQTACPGRHLYAKVPTIIAKASEYQHAFGGRELQHSFLRDPQPDALLLSSTGQVASARGTGPPGFDRPALAATGFGDDDQVLAVGDVTGDRIADAMARAVSTGVTSVYPGVGDGTFGKPVRTSRRWAATDLMAAPGDLDSDGVRDLVARDTATGSLRFYAGNGDGTFRAGTVAIARLANATALAGAGDFDRDGFRDLLVRDGRGALVLWRGTGTGTFDTAVVLVKDWTGRDLTAGGLDVTGDRYPDVVARNAQTGTLHIFANVGGTRLSPRIGSVPSAVRQLSLSWDITGDARPDLLAVTPRGNLVTLAGRRQNWLSPVRTRPESWPGRAGPMVVGDWDRDGYVDAMARDAATGRMWLYPGTAEGGFGAATGGWAHWGGRTMVTPVGDFDGDGWPDLLARHADGRIYWHPGRGDAGFAPPRLARWSGFPAGSTVAAVGRWDDDGAPDVVVRTRGGALLLYPGNGPGGLEDPVRIGGGFDQYNRIVGVGDLTGDGRPDLLARSSSGDVWLLPATASTAKRPHGGFAPKQYVASGWADYRFS